MGRVQDPPQEGDTRGDVRREAGNTAGVHLTEERRCWLADLLVGNGNGVGVVGVAPGGPVTGRINGGEDEERVGRVDAAGAAQNGVEVKSGVARDLLVAECFVLTAKTPRQQGREILEIAARFPDTIECNDAKSSEQVGLAAWI